MKFANIAKEALWRQAVYALWGIGAVAVAYVVVGVFAFIVKGEFMAFHSMQFYGFVFTAGYILAAVKGIEAMEKIAKDEITPNTSTISKIGKYIDIVVMITIILLTWSAMNATAVMTPLDDMLKRAIGVMLLVVWAVYGALIYREYKKISKE